MNRAIDYTTSVKNNQVNVIDRIKNEINKRTHSNDFTLYSYQERVKQYILDKRKCGVFMEMGLGKTLTSLSAIKELHQTNEISRTLVIAPKKVCGSTWMEESKRLNYFSPVLVSGTSKQKTKALLTQSNLYVANTDSVKLINKLVDLGVFHFDSIIVDESTNFKSNKSKRFKALREITKNIGVKILLTGTPMPNSPSDIFSQMLLIDDGEAFGKDIKSFRRQYTKYGKIERSRIYSFMSKIKERCMYLKAEDHMVDAPKVEYINKYFTMNNENLNSYWDFEKYKKIDAMNLSGNNNQDRIKRINITNKLCQFANGFVYHNSTDSKGKIVRHSQTMHTAKINELKKYLKDNPNENVLVAYNFKSDLEALKKEFSFARQLDDSGEVVKQWNEGKIKMLLLQPQSAGYGLNLQFGGHTVIWFGLTWKIDCYLQFNARVIRPKQKNKVKVVHLINEGTIDERIMEVITKKIEDQKEVLDFLLS